MTSTPAIRGLPRPLARALEAHADRLDIEAIRAAYDLAVDAHAGQLRASGEEYVQHTSATEHQVENYRKMLLSMATDAARRLRSPDVHSTCTGERP